MVGFEKYYEKCVQQYIECIDNYDFSSIGMFTSFDFRYECIFNRDDKKVINGRDNFIKEFSQSQNIVRKTTIDSYEHNHQLIICYFKLATLDVVPDLTNSSGIKRNFYLGILQMYFRGLKVYLIQESHLKIYCE